MTLSRIKQHFYHLPLSAAVLLIWLCSLNASDAKQEALPNILWITSEDSGPHLGCYGDDYAKTPNLDALAAKGMRYTNASSNAPVCAPARTAIITGIHPTAMGAHHMRSLVSLPNPLRFYPQLLRDAGYYTMNVNKTDYNVSVVKNSNSAWVDKPRDAHWDNRSEGQPFFAIFNYNTTHESQVRNEIKVKDMIHDPALAPIPAYHPDAPEVRKEWAQYYSRITRLDQLAGNKLKDLAAANLAEDTIIFYNGDHGAGMPRNKRWPYRSGLRVPLIVYFPEKYRHLAPPEYEPGGTSDRLVEFIDLAPTLLSLINQSPPEWMQGRAFAGHNPAPEREYSFGYRGRMDECYDEVRTVMNKQYIYLRHYMPHRIYGQYLEFMFKAQSTQIWQQMFQEGKLNAAQSLFWQKKPTEELYDFQADPDEVQNLAASDQPEHQAALQALRAAHKKHVPDIRDVGFLSEGEMHRRAKEAGVTPYELGRSNEHYNLPAIFDAAQVATSQNPEDLGTIVELLESDDSGVRYWGVTGLLIHGKEGYSAGRSKLLEALNDKNPSVAIVAAEAVGTYGSATELETALDVLLEYADADKHSAYDAMLALNAMDHLGDKVTSKVATIQVLPHVSKHDVKRTQNYPGRLIERILSNLGYSPQTEQADGAQP